MSMLDARDAEVVRTLRNELATARRERDEALERLMNNAANADLERDEARRTVERLRAALERIVNERIITPQLIAREALAATPSTEPVVPRDGNWIDKWGACKVCGGEIPHGHTDRCDIYKLEMSLFDAKAEAEKLATALERIDEVCADDDWDADEVHEFIANRLAPWRAAHPPAEATARMP